MQTEGYVRLFIRDAYPSLNAIVYRCTEDSTRDTSRLATITRKVVVDRRRSSPTSVVGCCELAAISHSSQLLVQE
jgi:hypothetical protein